MIEYKQHTFKNGLRLIHIQDQSLVAHFGVVFGTGSRDELIHEHGMAHFIEHMLFKGTKTRKPYHILSRMEDVGGEIDAYTTKEFIVLNSSFPKQYFSRAVELIADLTFNSTFPEKELKNEKEVVAEEIKMYKDSPSELIFDLFDEYQYADHPMGRNILGSVKSLKKFTP
ncbi:MAG: pitrilysin family protein, partial [Salinivirgaceae bacterium]|nr:pitrilysin family protein [Salinivirgaceae bacterium]